MFYTIVVVIQYIAIGLLTINLFYSIIQKPSRFQVHAILLTLATLLLYIGYNFEIHAQDLETAYSGIFISYIGKPFILMESFLLICEFLGKRINKFIFALLGLLCLSFPIMLYSNKYHHLFYKTIEFDRSLEFSPLKVTHGPYYYVFLGTCVLFISGAIGILVADIVKERHSKFSNRRKNVRFCAILMIFFALLGYALYAVDLNTNYDVNMIGTFLSVVTVFIMFVKFKAFDAVTIANESAMQDASVGLIIYDESMKLSYKNSLAEKILEHEAEKDKFQDLINIHEIEVDGKYYQLTPRDFYQNSVFVGKSIEINDITYSKKYQERLKRDVKERTEQIENIQRNIIESFADMIESRSIETGDHIKRTSYYSRLIAKELQRTGKYEDLLTDEYIDLVTLAAPLHDIGKISIPDSILLKPGKLTEEEFEKIKIHSKNGAVLIEKSLRNVESDQFIEVAKDIAESHHEWWNGKGYPNGLTGEDIPLAARIVALADSYDALTSPRCYKPAYPIKVAIKIIEEESGTHFDPVLAKIFCDKIKQV